MLTRPIQDFISNSKIINWLKIGAKNPSKSIEISKTFDFYFRHRNDVFSRNLELFLNMLLNVRVGLRLEILPECSHVSFYLCV